MRRIYENAAFLVRGGIFSQRFLSHTTYKDFEVRSAQLFFFSPYCENSVSVKHTHPLNESVLRGHLFNQVKHPPKTRILTNQVQMPGRGINFLTLLPQLTNTTAHPNRRGAKEQLPNSVFAYS